MSIALGDNKIDQIYINNTGANKIYRGTNLVYDRSLQNKFEYFYVYAAGGVDQGTVGTVSLKNGVNIPNVEYSYDGITWTTWNFSSLNLVGPVTSEESGLIYSFIFFRGNNPNGFSLNTSSAVSYFEIKDNINGKAYITIGGNIMSLLYKDSFWKEDIYPNNTIPVSGCFYKLFQNCNIYSCLGGPGYWMDDQQKPQPLNRFRLPAKNLTTFCYGSMFSNCSMLKYGPLILPATTLVDWCYSNMFQFGGIENAPLLPAMELKASCYQYMFYYCSKLKYIKTSATDISATNCMYRWLDSGSAIGTFVKKAGVTFPSGGSGIPEGWTVEEID